MCLFFAFLIQLYETNLSSKVGALVAKFLLGCLATVYAFTVRGGKNLKKYGEWAVVTGATDGIGQAEAFELAKKVGPSDLVTTTSV